MGERAAFVLNLDADLELGALGPYTPTKGVLRAMRVHALTLAKTLLREGDVLVDENTAPGSCEGLLGLAFSPTPSALAMLRRAGASVREFPSVEILRRVSRRDFAYLHELPFGSVCTSADEALTATQKILDEGFDVRCKRVHGMAGRGHRLVRKAMTEADLAFVRASDALVVEPNVLIENEVSLHGFLRRDHSLVRGELIGTRVDAHGAHSGVRELEEGEIDAEARAAIDASLEGAADELRRAGYHGPFGIDAYTYRLEKGGELRLRSRSETNSRYSMAWASGFAKRSARPDLESE